MYADFSTSRIVLFCFFYITHYTYVITHSSCAFARVTFCRLDELLLRQLLLLITVESALRLLRLLRLL